MDAHRRNRGILCSLLVLFFLDWSAAQISYSVTEEANKGTVIGNLAKDLNVNVNDLQSRNLNVVSGYSKKYFETNIKTGDLYVHERIDREELCPNSLKCTLNFEAILNGPMVIRRIEVDVVDLNDNAPIFVENSFLLNVYESSPTGEHFLLPLALDEDTGSNSVKTYKLSPNEYFSLDVQSGGERSASAELVLLKALDREKEPDIKLTLTAVDGGKPPNTGTVQIHINVLDVNDNTPSFSKTLYKARVKENAPPGSLVIQLNATDLDEGDSGTVIYSFVKRANFNPAHMFSLNPDSGEIAVKGGLDYESQSAYEVHVQATDKGASPRRANGKVLIEVVDVNDNAPEIVVTSLLNPVKEDAESGSVVALVTVTDKDGGKNGQTKCKVDGSVPFRLTSNYKNYYSLVVDGPLDRERHALYDITITAHDEGSPSLSSTKVIKVEVSDVNDNPPRFSEPVINIYVKENGEVGHHIYVIKAIDPDANENAKITYSLDGNSRNIQVTSFININSETGEITSLQSFDYEKLKTFQFKVQATDSGVPPLSSNVTVNVFVLDENDNSPSILAPYSEHGSVNSENIPYSAEAGYFVAKIRAVDPDSGYNALNVTVNVFVLDENDNSPSILAPYSEHGSVNSENIPYSAEAGYFVAKIRAVDPDSGYNALLSYHLSEPKGDNLFRIGTSSGEIRTKRRMSDNDLKSHPLLVLVCDNGEPSLSATVSIEVVVLESTADMQTPFRHVPLKEDSFSDLNLYLLIAIVSVSVIFLLSLISLVAVRCHRTDGSFSRYSAPMITTHPDGSWSYSKATQQYDVCFSSDTLKSDVVVFPAPFSPVDAELISINGADTFTRTQTLPNSEKVRAQGGGGAGTFPLCSLLHSQQQQQQGASVPTEVSDPFGSALPADPLRQWVGAGALRVNHIKSTERGKGVGERDERERLFGHAAIRHLLPKPMGVLKLFMLPRDIDICLSFDDRSNAIFHY
uniref:Cadherin domain-containing protein n=1 Tax=Oryzias latipes TaxID=8090 RepID=A0A3P9MBX9_ORYLA